MDTKKFSSNGKPRGGQNNTKTVLTAAGLSAVAGAASGAVIALKFGIKKKDEHEENPQEETHVTSTSQEEPQHEAPQQAQNTQQAAQPQQTSPSNDNITTPQPVDSTGGTGQISDPVQPEDTVQTEDTPSGDGEVDPDLIAQQIASSNETDPTDIDVQDFLTIDGMDLAYGPDGSEHTVAMVHTPDGGQYMLADIDGDGLFTDVFDLNGNYVGEAEGNLTASDLEEAADPTGGFIAYNGDEPIGEDPTNDIVATDSSVGSGTQNPEDNLLASNDDDSIELDDLLAQLLDSNEDSLSDIASREMIVDDTDDVDGSEDYSDDEEDEIEEDEIDEDTDDE